MGCSQCGAVIDASLVPILRRLRAGEHIRVYVTGHGSTSQATVTSKEVFDLSLSIGVTSIRPSKEPVNCGCKACNLRARRRQP